MATFDNNLMARVLLSNKLASREVLIEAMKDVTPATDIGQVLVEAGILKPEIYAKLCDFLRKYQAQQAATERLAGVMRRCQRPGVRALAAAAGMAGRLVFMPLTAVLSWHCMRPGQPRAFPSRSAGPPPRAAAPPGAA